MVVTIIPYFAWSLLLLFITSYEFWPRHKLLILWPLHAGPWKFEKVSRCISYRFSTVQAGNAIFLLSATNILYDPYFVSSLLTDLLISSIMNRTRKTNMMSCMVVFFCSFDRSPIKKPGRLLRPGFHSGVLNTYTWTHNGRIFLLLSRLATGTKFPRSCAYQ